MSDTQYYGAPGAIYTTSGAPTVAGTDEVQTIVKNSTVTAGTFRLAFKGYVTSEITWSATTAIMETALNNLPSIGAGGTGLVGVVVTGGNLPGTALTITFSGRNVSKRVQPALELYSNTLTGGGSMTIAEGTPGVDASFPTAPNGGILIRTDTGAIYVKTSGTWTVQV